MTDEEFYLGARSAGFSGDMARFLTKFVSRFPHEHTADQIRDFEDAVLETIEQEE